MGLQSRKKKFELTASFLYNHPIYYSQAHEVREEKINRVPVSFPEIIQLQSNHSDSKRDVLINLGMQELKQAFKPAFTAQQKDQVMEMLTLFTNAWTI